MNALPPQRRAYALDALRGFAILTMLLSGLIPWGPLPGWMYHAQVPPPDHVFNPDIPGITWVDLVFPFFIFSMGVAFPFALTRRLQKGETKTGLILSIFKRFIMLVFFAIVLEHFRPFVLGARDAGLPEWGWLQASLEDNGSLFIRIIAAFLEKWKWGVSLLGAVIIFFLWCRFPKNISRRTILTCKISAFIVLILALIGLSLHGYPQPVRDMEVFTPFRSGIILMVLASLQLVGSLIWFFTRENYLARLSWLGIFLGARLSVMANDNWVSTVWNHTEIPFLADLNLPDWFAWVSDFAWLGRMEYLKYIFIIIPGTIVGDMLLRWMQKSGEKEKPSWSTKRVCSQIILMIAFIVVALTGYYARWTVATPIALFLMSGAGWFLFANPQNSTERLLRNLFKWATYWLILGAILEPFEGGIKKDPNTFSYYFMTTALAIHLLIAFTLIIDVLKKQRWLQLLIDNGQNPMLAYMGSGNILQPILQITFLWEFFEWVVPEQYPWLGALRGFVYTFLIALIVQFFTRRKYFLRT